MLKNTYKCANFHMMFTELMTRKNFEDENDSDFVEKPYAVIRYIRTCAGFQKKLLGEQLSQTDILTKPEKYDILSSLLDKVFKLSDSCTVSMMNYDSMDFPMFKEKKA